MATDQERDASAERRRARGVGTTTTKGTKMVAIYLSDALYDDVRRAYLTERREGAHTPRSVAAWVSRAIVSYGTLSGAERRSHLEDASPRDGEKRSRPFRLTLDAVEVMDAKRAEDMRADIERHSDVSDLSAIVARHTRTAFVVAALRDAVATARDEIGVFDELPERLRRYADDTTPE